MKTKDLEKKSEVDLHKTLRENRENYRKFRFNISGSKTRDVKYGMKVKKNVARILTELNHRSKRGHAKGEGKRKNK